jgi:pilus assembly protein CpaB
MRRRAIAIFVGLLVALFGVFGVVVYAQGADSRAVAGQLTQDVYIAKVEVPRGTSASEALAQKLIVRQLVVTRGVPDGVLKEVTAVTGALVATSTIMPGEIVLSSRFGTASTQVQNKAVPDGTVAVTIDLADPNRIAPLLVPGSHIVLYSTFNARDARAADLTPNGEHLADKAEYLHATKVLLDDVEVIAVGDTSTVSGPKPSPSPDSRLSKADEVNKALVTVAVRPDQAVRLVHEIQTSELYAALRGVDVNVDPRAVTNDNSVVKR